MQEHPESDASKNDAIVDVVLPPQTKFGRPVSETLNNGG